MWSQYVLPRLEITSEAEELCSKPQEESKTQSHEQENNQSNGHVTSQVKPHHTSQTRDPSHSLLESFNILFSIPTMLDKVHLNNPDDLDEMCLFFIKHFRKGPCVVNVSLRINSFISAQECHPSALFPFVFFSHFLSCYYMWLEMNRCMFLGNDRCYWLSSRVIIFVLYCIDMED